MYRVALETSGKPIVKVSLLEALASLAEAEGMVAAALDAGRSEIYLGLYFAHPAENRTTLIHESLHSQAELLEQLEKLPEASWHAVRPGEVRNPFQGAP